MTLARPRWKRPLVSFIVPTLNRGRYVLRAVESCLAAASEAADVEVVVVDSASDDGSFRWLSDRFGGDARVRLVQNDRGAGPTRSWLDGARLVEGDFVTFVWSDDYISPDFISTLAPNLRPPRAVAYGAGVVRDVDDESPLPIRAESLRLPSRDLLLGYFQQHANTDLPISVSPCCSLFSRAVFDQWTATVEGWSRANPLREAVLWRRAIGPDLLLFLHALTFFEGEVICALRPVAQFSSHPGSITVSTARWPYLAGYWLARLWAVREVKEKDLFVALATRSVAFGILLYLAARFGDAGGIKDAPRQVVLELRALLSECGRRQRLVAVVCRLPGCVLVFVGRYVARLSRALRRSWLGHPRKA